jgi:hypothetical protein
LGHGHDILPPEPRFFQKAPHLLVVLAKIPVNSQLFIVRLHAHLKTTAARGRRKNVDTTQLTTQIIRLDYTGLGLRNQVLESGLVDSHRWQRGASRSSIPL